MVCSNQKYKKGYKKSKGKLLLKSKRYYIQSLLLFVIYITKSCIANPVGYSYSKFSGPVSGPEQEIVTRDEDDQYPRVDYVAKPDYHFAYGVEDPKSNVLHNREESRDGDAVKGEYSVIDPDGTHRIVRYTADKVNGFQAEVITDGKSSLHGHHDDDDDTPAQPPPPPVQHFEYHHRPPKPIRRYHHRHHGHPRHYTPIPTQAPAQYHTIRKTISEDDDDHSSADDDDDDDGY